MLTAEPRDQPDRTEGEKLSRTPAKRRPAVGVFVERMEDAAPTVALAAAVVRTGVASRGTLRAAAALAVAERGPILRVRPHDDYDACGYDATHAAYTLTYAVPMLCQLPQPPQEEDFRVMRQQCRDCAAVIEAGAGMTFWPGVSPEDATRLDSHVTWWDISEPITMYADVIDPDERVRRALEAGPFDATSCTPDQVRLAGGTDQLRELHERRTAVAARSDMSADRYDWDRLAGRLATLCESGPRLTAEQRVSIAGARLCLLREETADAEKSAKSLMYNASREGSGPGRLAALSGISRRTVPGWVAQAANDLETATENGAAGTAQGQEREAQR